MKTEKTVEEHWIIQNNSDFIKSKKTMQGVISACYLNLFLNEQGIYDKNFTTMNDEDYIEYTAILERLHNVK